MSKSMCMVAGCTAVATDHVTLETTEVTSDNKPIRTDVHICEACHQRLDDYSDGHPITFDDFPIETVTVIHLNPDREGFAECDSVWFMIASDDSDAFDPLNVGLFDKEPLQIDGALVDVEND